MMQYRNNDDNMGHVKLTLHDICQGILNGSIPLAGSDTAATSNAFLSSAPMLPTGTMSTAVFHLPNRATAAATMIHKLHHNLREPVCSVNIVPSLVGNSLLSTVKMVKPATQQSMMTRRSTYMILRPPKSWYWQTQSSKGGNIHGPK